MLEASEKKQTPWIFQHLAQSKFAGGGSTLTHINGKLYAFGGCDREGMETNDVFCFDPDTCVWSEALPLQTSTKPCKRFGHSAVCFGSLLYIYGGQTFKVAGYEHHQEQQQAENDESRQSQELTSATTIHNDVYYFDTKSLVWNKVNTKIVDAAGSEVEGTSSLKRHSHVAIPLPNGNMLVFGGASEQNEILNDVWQLNLKTGLWARVKINCETGIWPCAREMHSTCYNTSSKDNGCTACQMYVMGGRNADGAVLGDMWLLSQDGVDDDWRWHKLQSAPAARCAHASTFIDQKLCHFGGWDGHGTIYNDIAIYNADENTWDTRSITSSSACLQPEGRFGHSCCSLNQSTMIVMGGVNVTNDRNDFLAISSD